MRILLVLIAGLIIAGPARAQVWVFGTSPNYVTQSNVFQGVWAVSSRPAQTFQAQADAGQAGAQVKTAPAKACPCSPECVCGCNQGKPCACGNGQAAPATLPAPLMESVPDVRPDRLPPVQFNNWYPGPSFPRMSARGGGGC